MIEQRCRTCTWWGESYDHDDAMAAGVAGWRECELVAAGDSSGAMSRNRAAFAYVDCEDAFAGASLYTAPNFGCVQWQGKEE